MRVLFITSTRIGDAVLSTGLLGYLLEHFPAARFTIACGPHAAGLFARMPSLDRLLVIEKQRFDMHWPLLWAKVAATRWDWVIDLRGSALSFLLMARRRSVMRGGRRPGHRLACIAALLGLSPPPLPVVWTAPEDEAVAAGLLPRGAVLGLGPTANWAGKMWPAENFVALAQALQAEQPGLGVAVFAGPGAAEAAAAAPVLAALPGAIDLAGRLTLAQAAACLARCSLFVGNDSGLMHLAAAAGAPTLGLFGPTSAVEYAPAGRLARAVLADGPGGETPIARLGVAAVLQAARALLAAGTRAAA